MTTNKIILPEFGAIKDKDGKTIWGRLPYQFTFTNKEEYLTWRKTWKHTYKELSENIKQAKGLRNNGFRNKDANVYKFQSDCLILKEQARSLMKILEEGKTLSWSMKNAAYGK